MVKQHYYKSLYWVERNRFLLLLISTVLTIVLPAFFGSGMLSEIIFVVSISFLFIQSMVAANIKKSRRRVMRIVVLTLIVVSWLRPAGFDSMVIEIIKLVFFVAFFIFVMIHLGRYIIKSNTVDTNVLITSINIYLLAGIVGASLCVVMYRMYPDAYNFPSYINTPVFAHFLYYSFITLSTVGYGDITPRIPETMTLAYMLSVIGQLYVAIIIAFLIGKFLMQGNQKKEEPDLGNNEIHEK
jgi:voltage-gated potassium channel